MTDKEEQVHHLTRELLIAVERWRDEVDRSTDKELKKMAVETACGLRNTATAAFELIIAII